MATSLSRGGVRSGVTMTLPGETEAWSAGKQPCRGIAWWAHRDDQKGACAHSADADGYSGAVPITIEA